MNPLIAVIADDLTGVCDTGAQFAAAGLRAVASVNLDFQQGDVPHVILVNTQSRSMKEGEAAQSLFTAVSGLRPVQPRWFFKKIDTALRGNIGVEMLSMLRALEVRCALSISSIPGAGRTTVGGIQYYRGKPIKESIHGEDRYNPNPVWTSSHIELLSKIPELDIENIPLAEVRSGSLRISNRINGRGKRVLVFDSETDDDIDRIVRASMDLEPTTFFYTGSFGLSSSLGRYLAKSCPDIQSRPAAPVVKETSRETGRVLIVSGSSHPRACSQMAWIEKTGMARVMRVAPEDLLDRLTESTAETIRAFRDPVRLHGKAGIRIGGGKAEIGGQSQEIVAALGQLVGHLLDAYDWKALVLIGGDTGYAVSRAVGIRQIEIGGNISFVAAYGKPMGSMKPLDMLVTKGGSLGEEDTLAKILTFIDHI